MMDKAFFGKLPADVQAALLEAGDEAAAYVAKMLTDSEGDYIKKWAAAGAEIIDPDLDGFRAATKGIVKSSFPELQPWVDRIKAAQ